MNKVNPAFILRNYLLEEAIREADDKGNFKIVDKLLALSEKPYETPADENMTKIPPEWAYCLSVSCSS